MPFETISPISPPSMLRPGRKITGMSAILLPLSSPTSVDWKGFEDHVQRTFDAGLIPAINMDTGYGNLIDAETRRDTLARAQSIAAGKEFIAGAFVHDHPGSAFDRDGYGAEIKQIQEFSGTPILFQSYGLAHCDDQSIVANYQNATSDCDRFLAFELGEMFAPFGKIYSLEVYRQLLKIDACKGAKHSSLSRELEWQRLLIRDEVRPEFMVLTGNDLAIDMVMYGSDYLLGLSTFAPDAFAKRDQMWEESDASFYELNDLLQYLGAFTFRPPVPAYKHNAAMFLKLRNQIVSDATYAGSPERPDVDRKVLEQILSEIELRISDS